MNSPPTVADGNPSQDKPAFFQHPQALVETSRIGARTRVWAFAHVLPGAVVGEDCNICDHVFIENDVVVGHRVTVKCGVQLWDGVRLEDDVFVGPNATFTNDASPRSRKRPDAFLVTTVARGASIGANATILPGVTVGMGAVVGAGSVVTRSVPPYALVTGNPARISGYVTDDASRLGHRTSASVEPATARKPEVRELCVPGATLLRMPEVEDLRGALTFGEVGRQLPFTPKRYFVVYNVPGKDVRGEHAHRELHQLLVCLSGSVSVVVDNGRVRDEVVLDTPTVALHLSPMVWGIQYHFTPDAVLLVLASDVYREEDYIRNYGDYLHAMGV